MRLAAAAAVAVSLSALGLPARPVAATPARCTAEQAKSAVRAFLAAWNTGDVARLDALVARDDVFRWFSATRAEALFVAFSRDALLRYAARRHRAGERLTLLELTVSGDFVYDLGRTAPDFAGGAPVRYSGKGAVDCATGAPAISVWSMGVRRRQVPLARAGGSWESLRRALRLPWLEPGSDCPRSSGPPGGRLSGGVFGSAPALGRGPVYAMVAAEPPEVERSVGGNTGVVRYSRAAPGGWHSTKVLWISSPRYGGPALVRGRRIDRPGAVAFGAGARPVRKLRLWRAGANEPGAWRHRPSDVRVRTPGCYSLQIDGRHFSTSVTFEAAA